MNMSWGNIADMLYKIGMPLEVVHTMPDMIASLILKRPIIDINRFDDWLHSKFGDYENEGLGMCDIVSENFPEQENQIKYILGLDV